MPDNPKDGDYWFNAVDGRIYTFMNNKWHSTFHREDTIRVEDYKFDHNDDWDKQPVKSNPDHYGDW